MKRKNKLYFFIFFMFVLSLCLFLFVIYLKHINVIKIIELNAILSVGDVPSFNTENDTLYFGTITSNTSSQRTLTVENNYDFPIKVEFSVKGNIEEFLVFDKIIFLDVEESKEVNISTIILTDEKQGNYSGRFIVTIKKSWKENSK